LTHAVYCADQSYWLVNATGFPFGSDRLNTASPVAIWEQIQAAPSKKAALRQIYRECGEVGGDMPRVIAATQSA
jgi:hypothetical protein